jgi:hypothetical protein
MSNQTVESKVAEALKTLGNIIESTALLKTSASKNITISDWDELVLKVSTLRPDLETICQLLKDIAPDIDGKIDKAPADKGPVVYASSYGEYGWIGVCPGNTVPTAANAKNTIVHRDDYGGIKVPTGILDEQLEDSSVLPKKYIEKKLNGKVDKAEVSTEAEANKIVQRDKHGGINVPTNLTAESLDEGSVLPKCYIDNALNELKKAIDAINVFFEGEDIDEAVDTLKEIEGFLTSGDRSVIDLYERLNNKVNKLTDKSRVYATDGNGNPYDIIYTENPDGSTVVVRTQTGNILVPENTPNFPSVAPSKKYVDENLVNKIDKSTIPYCAYGTGGGGTQTMYPVGPAASQGVIPMRTTSGQIIAPNQEKYAPDIDQFVSKRYTDNLINPLEKRVEQLESATMDYVLDKSTAVEKLVPVRSGMYARLKALGGASYKSNNVIDPKSVMVEASGGSNDETLPTTIGDDGSINFTIDPNVAGNIVAFIQFPIMPNGMYRYNIWGAYDSADEGNGFDSGVWEILCYCDMDEAEENYIPTSFSVKVTAYRDNSVTTDREEWA